MDALPPISLTAIYCQGNPADHGAAFFEQLQQEQKQIQVFAAPVAVKKFQDRQIPFVEFAYNKSSEGLAESIARKCSKSKVVMVDIGHPFSQQVLEILRDTSPHIMRVVYYDNPERLVPGKWSEEAAKTMALAHRVLFANANLAHEPIYKAPGQICELEYRKRFGVGYYPFHEAERVEARRKVERESMRSLLFSGLDLRSQEKIEDRGQKLIVYIGANNADYFENAFPAFISYLEQAIEQGADLSQTVIALHQHPGAKIGNEQREPNVDLRLLKHWLGKQKDQSKMPRFILSTGSFEHAQIAADGILYYQTSSSPQFVLAGIPTARVAHPEEQYEDMVVSNWLGPDLRDGPLLKSFLQTPEVYKISCNKQQLHEKLGIRSDWVEAFKSALTPPERRKRSWFWCCG